MARHSVAGVAQLRGFHRRAAVVPEDTWPKRLVGCVEQRRPVHLARESDAARGGELSGCRFGELIEYLSDCAPPLRRVLLRPAWLGTRHIERCGLTRDDPLRFVYQQRLDRGGPDIKAQVHVCATPRPQFAVAGRRSKRIRLSAAASLGSSGFIAIFIV